MAQLPETSYTLCVYNYIAKFRKAALAQENTFMGILSTWTKLGITFFRKRDCRYNHLSRAELKIFLRDFDSRAI